jgi:beta-galactosidase
VKPEALRPFEPNGVLFGAAYYHEYQPVGRLDEDLDLMKAAHFTVIRVGESVWSTWEPRNGEFDLEWLQPVLDGAHARGIGVILGTPTYAIPPWLQKLHPELAAERSTGQRIGWGGRQEVDYSSPTFRVFAERVIRAVIGRYADHPAVIGFQVDNEPGLHLFHNAATFRGFVQSLKKHYGDTETLNREWGLTYWSHRITEWDELWVPDGNTLPQYDLAWRRYQASLTAEFISWQARIVREYSGAEQFVTTCIAYPRPALHDADIVRDLDVTAGNPYYGMQDHLAMGRQLVPFQPWTTTGVWGLYRQADRIYSSKQSRFLVTETNAQTISGSDQNYPPYPGQLMQAALALVSRGAAMIEYWHWHSLHFGTETYWGGVLPHSQRPGRIYREVAEIGAVLESIGSSLDGYTPDADVTLLWSHDSKWAFEFSPPLHAPDGSPDRASYQRIFDAFYRGVVESGAQARIVHTDQITSRPAAQVAADHPVLIVPALYVADDEELTFLRDYAQQGGHLVIGIRTGYGDEEARARLAVAPAFLTEAAGVWYEEFSNLHDPVAVSGSDGFATSPDAQATGWADGLVADGAQTLVRYEHHAFGRFPAVTTAVFGTGRVTTVGTVPNVSLGIDLGRWLVPKPLGAGWLADASSGVTVASGTTSGGTRTWFLHNWSCTVACVTVPHAVVDRVSGTRHSVGEKLSLEPWTCRVLADE